MMSIKSIAVAAALAVGTLGVASKADAQVIYSGGTYYNPGTVVYPASGTYYSSGYVAPAYSTSYYSPYSTGYYNNGYYNNGYYNYSPYSNMYYSGYNNVYSTGAYGFGVGTRGAVYGGRRIWRW
jgi:hypothetical protein